MRRAVSLALILIIMQFIVAVYLFPLMPERIAIHWNLSGEADGYGSKLVGLFLIPVIEVFLIPLFLVLPRIDPKATSRLIGTYEWFILVFTLYMFYVFGLSVAWNLGYRFDFLRLLVPMFGILFYGIGDILGRVEMNWFLGIRTPWTMSSQEVWDDTHRLGGLLFKLSGLLAFVGVFFGGWVSLVLSFLPVMLSGLYVTIYSYTRYKQLTRTKQSHE